MLLRTHLTIAVFCFLFLYNYLPGNKIIFGIAFLIATFLVDIDSRKSKAGNHWYLRPFQLFVSHRGVLHSLLFGFILSLFLFFISQDFGVGFFFGYVLHLLVDCFTTQGVSLFWPVDLKIRIFGIRSGGLIEQIIFVLVLLTDVWLIINWAFF
jgi:inner membrane protein